ncbi:MAG: C-type lectin domain-containing protein [Synergistaceae bacterium]|nr:C-type lectin domain-containing protein [Synergistaceae bacterium]
MRKILAAALVLMICACSEAFEVPSRNITGSLRFELDEGLSAELCGIVRDINADGDIKDCVFTLFLVTAREDMMLSVSSDAVYSILGRKFPDYLGASVAGNASESEIIGEFPTPVWFVHRVPASYGELPKFSRMQFAFNGKSVTLRGQGTMKWEDWKNVNARSNELLELWAETYTELSAMYTEKQSVKPSAVKHDMKALEGSQIFRGHHYKVFYKMNDWFEAAVACQKIGGYLAIITDDDERSFIESILPVNTKDTSQIMNSREVFWTGDITDTSRPFKIVWRRKNGMSFTYTDTTNTAYAYICEWDY